jgi:hypothetical protein
MIKTPHQANMSFNMYIECGEGALWGVLFMMLIVCTQYWNAALSAFNVREKKKKWDTLVLCEP